MPHIPPRRRPHFVSFVLLGAALSTPVVARADEGAAFELSSTGIVTDLGIGLSRIGATALGELGGQSSGIRTLDGERWLLRWDGLLAARGGFLGSTVPFTPLVGGHGLLDAALGYRLRADRSLSPYVGARGGFEVGWLPPVGVRSALLSDMDGVGGFTASGQGRLELGASYLAGGRSLLLVAFVQEAWQAATAHAPSSVFTDAGFGVRYDVARGLTLGAEASLGTRAARRDPALDRIDQTTRERFALTVRKVFANGTWLGADLSAVRELDRIRYEASGATYHTAGQPALGLTVSFGIPFGPRR